MNLTNKQIRERARELLDENVFGKDWCKSVLTLLISAIIETAIIFALFVALAGIIVLPIANLVASFLPGSKIIIPLVIALMYFALTLVSMGISGNIAMGLTSVHLDLVRGEGHISIRKFFEGFKNFTEDFLLGFMYTLHFTLWSLLGFFPGLYVGTSYALIFHVRKDNPDYRWQQCFDESERLMQGNRWRYFKLNLSFLGWFYVGLLFGGIGALWAMAYQQTAVAVFYEQVKAEKESNIVDFNNMGSTNPVVYDGEKKSR